MKSQSSQVTNSNIHFDEVTTKAFFPGAFELIDITHHLIQSRAKSIANNQKLGITTNDERSILGILGSSQFLLGHTTEILLKFKLQLDGHAIPKIHDLHALFNMLSQDSRKHIESEYQRLKNTYHPADTEWPSVDSLFNLHREYHTDWKYVVEENSNLDAPFPFLRLAAKSIYKTL